VGAFTWACRSPGNTEIRRCDGLVPRRQPHGEGTTGQPAARRVLRSAFAGPRRAGRSFGYPSGCKGDARGGEGASADLDIDPVGSGVQATDGHFPPVAAHDGLRPAGLEAAGGQLKTLGRRVPGGEGGERQTELRGDVRARTACGGAGWCDARRRIQPRSVALAADPGGGSTGPWPPSSTRCPDGAYVTTSATCSWRTRAGSAVAVVLLLVAEGSGAGTAVHGPVPTLPLGGCRWPVGG
jgi:hypothetical protein